MGLPDPIVKVTTTGEAITMEAIDELRADILKAKSLIPGTHRLNLHEIYGDFQGKHIDRDEVEPAHFQSWMEWGKENGMKLDFNSTSCSHPKSGDLLTKCSEFCRNYKVSPIYFISELSKHLYCMHERYAPKDKK